MPTREDIKKWLKENRLKYQWLADECNVSLGTVNAWLSYRVIPAAKLIKIAELMNFKEETESVSSRLVVEVLPETQMELEKLALESGLTLSGFISAVLEKIAHDDELREHVHRFLSRPSAESESYIISALRSAGSEGDA